MTENLKAAAYSAGLSEKDKRKIDNLSKALSVHKQLLNMPQDAANAVYNKFSPAQQQNLVQNFGEEPETEKNISAGNECEERENVRFIWLPE